MRGGKEEAGLNGTVNDELLFFPTLSARSRGQSVQLRSRADRGGIPIGPARHRPSTARRSPAPPGDDGELRHEPRHRCPTRINPARSPPWHPRSSLRPTPTQACRPASTCRCGRWAIRSSPSISARSPVDLAAGRRQHPLGYPDLPPGPLRGRRYALPALHRLARRDCHARTWHPAHRVRGSAPACRHRRSPRLWWFPGDSDLLVRGAPGALRRRRGRHHQALRHGQGQRRQSRHDRRDAGPRLRAGGRHEADAIALLLWAIDAQGGRA